MAIPERQRILGFKNSPLVIVPMRQHTSALGQKASICHSGIHVGLRADIEGWVRNGREGPCAQMAQPKAVMSRFRS